MPDPVLEPPTPVIRQADSPEEIARVTQNMQQIFDRVSPKIRGTPTPESPPEPQKTAETSTDKIEPAKEQPQSTTEIPPDKSKQPEKASEDHKLPSFIEKALAPEPVKPQSDEEWPDELPTFKSSEEAKARYKNWREKYNALKKESEQLRARPQVDESVTQKLSYLENQNKEMATQLSRLGVEQHQEFQQKIIQPMQQAWNEAARIVDEAGGSSADLGKALALRGKAQYEALDEIFSGMPESAKIEANEAIRSFRRLDDARMKALADAPKTAEALKKADMQRQYQYLNAQKEEMKNLFDNAIHELRETAKVEVLQKSTDPDAKWWNDQADQIVDTSRQLFLENTDMKKVAFALALAPMADVYRKLWLAERQARGRTDKVLSDKFGSEPSLSDSGGNYPTGTNVQEDLKKPFTDVFLREFHRARESGVK